MVNRDNWKIVKKYLEYRESVLQNDEKTVRSAWSCLRHVLTWADKTPFADVQKLRPTLPEYILKARADGKEGTLSPARMEKILAFSRNMFEWMRLEYPSKYKHLAQSWIGSLRVRRSHSKGSRLPNRKFWKLEEVEQVMKVKPDSLRTRRDQAALAFLFLSAMRGAAFVTLPIRSVDLETRRVYQLPEWGVKTKNSKAAITYLLPIDSLLRVVRDWDQYVRTRVKNVRTAWYASLHYDGLHLYDEKEVTQFSPTGRRGALYEGLKDLCERAGVEWKSPHLIRHGHGVYGAAHAQTMEEYKALSQNMMHETIETTDKYTDFENDKVGDIIRTFK